MSDADSAYQAALNRIPPEVAGIKGLERLDLDATQVRDLTPLQALTGLQRLDLDQTQVSDLRPIRDLLDLGEGDFGGLRFANTPATSANSELARLSRIKNAKDRTQQTLAYLRSLPPWPAPLPGQDDKAAGEATQDARTDATVKTAQAQIAFLLEHAATSQVAATTTASQIRFALRDVPPPMATSCRRC